MNNEHIPVGQQLVCSLILIRFKWQSDKFVKLNPVETYLEDVLCLYINPLRVLLPWPTLKLSGVQMDPNVLKAYLKLLLFIEKS